MQISTNKQHIAKYIIFKYHKHLLISKKMGVYLGVI